MRSFPHRYSTFATKEKKKPSHPENTGMDQVESHCKKLFHAIGFHPKGTANRGNLNML